MRAGMGMRREAANRVLTHSKKFSPVLSVSFPLHCPQESLSPA